MFRAILLSLGCFLTLAAEAPAQVFVRAPFVRVFVDGPNWHVRAPFVNIGSGGYYAPDPVIVVPATKTEAFANGQANSKESAPTIQDFIHTFQATVGAHEATILNPATGTPTTVKFTLPDGNLREIRVTQRSVEFSYGLRGFVRIDFDEHGATVSSRI